MPFTSNTFIFTFCRARRAIMERVVRRFTFLLMVLSLASSLLSCEKSQPVTIGFVGGITGRVADLGVAGRNGAMLAVEQRNAQGGIHGRHVELITRDDEQNPETARTAVKELIDHHVEAIIGPMTSSIAMATIPLVNESKVVMMSPTVTTKEVSGQDDHFFRVISSTAEYATKTARYQMEKLGHRRAAAIYDQSNRAYTENWLHDFRATFEALGGQMVKVRPFQPGRDIIFLELAKELLAARPDVILIITNAVDAALIAQQVRKLDTRVALNLAEWAATERLLELGGSAVEGALFDQYFKRNDTSERFTLFLNAYRERFGMEPGFAGVAAYDAATVILDVLDVRKPGQPLKEAILAAGSFPGVQQTIAFDKFGDARRTTYISTIRNGRFVTVE
jgi:branched-chain amino acid transport system substrate-binding protein